MEKMATTNLKLSVIIPVIDEKKPSITEKIQKMDGNHVNIEVIYPDQPGEWKPSVLNKLIEKSQGDYLYFYDPICEFNDKAVCQAVSYLDAHDKTNIAVIRDELREEEETDKLLHSELEIDTQIGWFNFVVRNNQTLFAENVCMKAAYLEYYLKMIGKKGYFAYIGSQFVTKNPKAKRYDFGLSVGEDYLQMYDFLLDLLEKGKVRGKCTAFTQSVVTQAMCDIIRSYGLIPQNADAKEKAEVEKKIVAIMNEIEPAIILTNKKIDRYLLPYLFSYCDEKCELLSDSGDIGLYINETKIFSADHLDYRIVTMRKEGDKLFLQGYFTCPFLYNIPYTIYQKNGKKRTKVNTKESVYSYQGTKDKVANSKDFELVINLKKYKEYSYFVKVNGYVYDVLFSYQPQLRLNRIKTYRVLMDRTMCYFGKKVIKIEPLSWKAYIRYLYSFNKEIKQTYPKEYAVRQNMKKAAKKSGKVILYVDRNTEDGFYDFFKKEAAKKDKYQRYYIADFVAGNSDNEIRFSDKRYAQLFMEANAVITSSPVLDQYCPYDEIAYKFGYDLMNTKIVYAHAAAQKENSVAVLEGAAHMDEVITY